VGGHVAATRVSLHQNTVKFRFNDLASRHIRSRSRRARCRLVIEGAAHPLGVRGAFHALELPKLAVLVLMGCGSSSSDTG
jgi:hypothetical protein